MAKNRRPRRRREPAAAAPQTEPAADEDLDARLVSALSEIKQLQRERQNMPAAAPAAALEAPPPAPAPAEELPRRLHIAETVMRKLYERNVELERRVAEASAVPRLEALRGHADDHAKFALERKDKRIAELEAEVARLSALAGAASGPAPGPAPAPAAAPVELETALRESRVYKESYAQMRADYSALLAQRTRRRRGGGGNGGDGLVASLSERLAHEENERRVESELYNQKLYAAEQKSCDWFVERKLMEQQLAAMKRDVEERDALERRIEECVFSVFQRLQQLEVENASLRASVSRGTSVPVPAPAPVVGMPAGMPGASGPTGRRRRRG